MAHLRYRSAILSTCLIFLPPLYLHWRTPIAWLPPSTQPPVVRINAGGGGLDLSSPRAPFVA
ncbi:hypothetical protein PG993_001432 [Apiospora rasikravindrae]|uniref:Uncharacterized protein n=1 Tax=Apiospora rasikravindrae TaxID=990691 RepID=A0ABR1UBD6_9PEZI